MSKPRSMWILLRGYGQRENLRIHKTIMLTFLIKYYPRNNQWLFWVKYSGEGGERVKEVSLLPDQLNKENTQLQVTTTFLHMFAVNY